jgi:Zn-dependent protease
MQDLTLVPKIAVSILPLLFAITLHEAAHGWVANRLGDSTAKMLGRVSLNPLRHIDLLGTVILPLGMILLQTGFIFGWAKPVPVDYRNLHQPKRDMGIVAIAGPSANLLMMILWALLMRLAVTIGDTAPWIAEPLLLMGGAGVLFNAVLMVLNLFPLLPLDGGRVLVALLPPRAAAAFSRLEPYGLIILILLLFSGILGSILWPVVLFVENLVAAPLGLTEIIYGVQGLIFT